MGDDGRAKRLSQVAVATPCHAPWSAMSGGDSIRHCGTCRKDVFNLSAMSADEVEALLATAEDLCIRYYTRPDGTLVTSPCATAEGRAAPARLAAAVAATLTLAAPIAGVVAAVRAGPVAVRAEPERTDGLRVAMGLRFVLRKAPGPGRPARAPRQSDGAPGLVTAPPGPAAPPGPSAPKAPRGRRSARRPR